MSNEEAALRAKWCSWVNNDGPIRVDVMGMHFKRTIWRAVNDMLLANPEVGNVPSVFWDYYDEGYAAAQALAVRRQADRAERSVSLARLIEEIRDNPQLLTPDYYVALLGARASDEKLVQMMTSGFEELAGTGDQLDPKIPGNDLVALGAKAKQMRMFVNEHLAHIATEPKVTDLPTYQDLHAAIDFVGGLYQKYGQLLTGSVFSLEPSIPEDWRAIFRQPWLRS